MLAVAALGGCSDANGSGEQVASDRGQVLTMRDGTTVLVGAPSENGMSALLRGRVMVSGPAHCLGVQGEDGSASVVVWHDGTTVTADDGKPVIAVGGTKYSLGETIELGGGVVPVSVITTLTVPPECGVDEVFVAGP
jgi:predicted lipoprotein with Yx(FWY)xxD motif